MKFFGRGFALDKRGSLCYNITVKHFDIKVPEAIPILGTVRVLFDFLKFHSNLLHFS